NIDEINIGGGDRGDRGDRDRVSHRDNNRSRNNIYNNQNGVSTMDKKPGQSVGSGNRGNRPQAGTGAVGTRPPSANNQLPNNRQAPTSRQNNNVYADRDGNVYQKDDKGNWNQRDNRSQSWQSARDNPSTNNLNRESQARDRGNNRTNNFNQQRSTAGS